MIVKTVKLHEERDSDIIEYLNASPKVSSSDIIRGALRFAMQNANAYEYVEESLPSLASRIIWIVLNACTSSFPSSVSTKELYELAAQQLPELKGSKSPSGDNRLEKGVRWSLFILKEEALIQKGAKRGTYLFCKEMKDLIPLVQSSEDLESFRAAVASNFTYRLAVREDSPYSKLMM